LRKSFIISSSSSTNFSHLENTTISVFLNECKVLRFQSFLRCWIYKYSLVNYTLLLCSFALSSDLGGVSDYGTIFGVLLRLLQFILYALRFYAYKENCNILLFSQFFFIYLQPAILSIYSFPLSCHWNRFEGRK
jgi:hypothetical protein